MHRIRDVHAATRALRVVAQIEANRLLQKRQAIARHGVGRGGQDLVQVVLDRELDRQRLLQELAALAELGRQVVTEETEKRIGPEVPLPSENSTVRAFGKARLLEMRGHGVADARALVGHARKRLEKDQARSLFDAQLAHAAEEVLTRVRAAQVHVPLRDAMRLVGAGARHVPLIMPTPTRQVSMRPGDT